MYLKAYKVSTCHKKKETTAIVQSGNSRAAVRKFMFHVYPELFHDDMEKLPSSVIDGRKYQTTDSTLLMGTLLFLRKR